MNLGWWVFITLTLMITYSLDIGPGWIFSPISPDQKQRKEVPGAWTPAKLLSGKHRAAQSLLRLEWAAVQESPCGKERNEVPASQI